MKWFRKLVCSLIGCRSLEVWMEGEQSEDGKSGYCRTVFVCERCDGRHSVMYSVGDIEEGSADLDEFDRITREGYRE